MQLNPNGLVNGTVRVDYDKLKKRRFWDPQINFLGRFDTSTKKMVLALQVPKLSEPGYHKADSVYYSYVVTQVADSLVMTLLADKKKAPDFNYQTASQSYTVSMLPHRMRFVKTERVQVPAVKHTEPVAAPGRDKKIQLPQRDKDIQHTILLDTSLIKIDLYDNGEIDNDIITLLLDGKTIARSQLLARKPFSLSLDLSKEPTEHLLEMFADNLGSIPPNTALLVLTCKQKRYELNLSSNGKVNGSVKLLVRP
jgi:hypothetical protein